MGNSDQPYNGDMNNTALERMRSLQKQIMAMAPTGTVTTERVVFCTAGKFTPDEIEATVAALRAFGILR